VQVDNNLCHIQQVNDDNVQYLKSKVQEVEKLKEIQAKNIDRGFEELVRRIEDKKSILKAEFNQKYEREKIKLEDVMKPYLQVQIRLDAIKRTYEELHDLLTNKKSAHVLSKISDIMQKMKQASETL